MRKTKESVWPKYHKLFTGLSELSWSDVTDNVYATTEIFEKCNIESVYAI